MAGEASKTKRQSAMRSSSKSPSRKRTPSRGRSRSRSRSRGRSPGRPPGRPPGRARSKSPASTKAEKLPKAEKVSKAEKLPKSEKLPKAEKETTPTRISRRIKIEEQEVVKSNHNEMPTRVSARIAAIQNERPNTHEEPLRLESKSRVPKTRLVGMGSAIGALVCALTTPLFLVVLVRHCSKKDCTFLKLPTLPKTLSSLYDRRTLQIFAAISTYLVLLSLIPFGKLVEGTTLRNGKRLKYRCNGLGSLLVTLVGWCVAAFYFKYPVTFYYDHTFLSLYLHIVITLVLSKLFYLKARWAGNGDLNPNGNSGNVVYDWFMGHELNPRLGRFDFKFFLIGRGPLIGLTLYNASLLAKSCATTHAAPSHTLLLITGMQLLYALDGLWFEEETLYRWDMRHEGLGHLTLQTYCLVRPVMLTLTTRFVYSQNVRLSDWTLAAIFFVFAAGYVVYRGSSSQKFFFRKNPFDPSLSHLESIPTSTGKRLLVSGWWGLVRHPNYLGEIMMALAWCLACGFSHFFPYIYVIYVSTVLVGRALRDDRHLKKAYGAAWNNYAHFVPHRLIPKIW